ncbi:DUF1768 domain-containing protein [Saccharobesus litoralis]|uniref:DUF1768 domain-containing protein n=2 Tax=Saccharobesus litoralis TaxID=2172099 RepID=A0A2S0VXZ9_9ALTE|nr:DUF1768 domain-containing protein [Saccharobesus litoralis]
MPLFAHVNENAHFFSMNDAAHDWSRTSNHAFELEGVNWPSVEHYYQAMRFSDESYREQIRQADLKQAIKLGKAWFKKKRSDWKKVETVVMTRALYTKFKTHPELSDSLLATGEEKLIESSLYDHFWGCGRDQRGDNHYGQVLMNIRAKLRQEITPNTPE